MTTKHVIPSTAHPLIAATLPGLCGLTMGIICSIGGSAMGYRFGQLFVPMESPESDPRLAMLLGVVIPWLLFLGFFLVGLLLMRFYRRGLRNYHDLLVGRLLLAKGEKRPLPNLLQLKIEWPLLASGLILLGAISYGDSAQEAVWSMSGFCGLLASVMTTYAERKNIYDDAVNALGEVRADSGSPSAIGNLPARVKALLVITALVVCMSSLPIIFLFGRIVMLTGELVDLTGPQ
ncbi:MAG: hypothetical protein JNK74_02755 [Candidatus Hydrogenedentes bacterium]|nr:hypothetical protein [Candidatus Hydrogenedentota bacterium]